MADIPFLHESFESITHELRTVVTLYRIGNSQCSNQIFQISHNSLGLCVGQFPGIDISAIVVTNYYILLPFFKKING